MNQMTRFLRKKWLVALLTLSIQLYGMTAPIISNAAGTDPVSIWALGTANNNTATGSASNIGRSVSVFGGTGAISPSSTWWGPTCYYYVFANNWVNGSGTKGFKIVVDTRNFNSIKISYSQASGPNGANAGPRDFKLQYSLNDTDYYDVAGSSATLGDFWSGVVTKTDLALPQECEDKSAVYLRWVMTSNSGVNGLPISTNENSMLASIDVKGVEIPRPPIDISLSNSTLASNSPSNTTIGTLTVTDPNAGDSHVLSLVAGEGSTNNASFTLVGNQLRSSGVLSQGTYSIRVNANDGTFDYAEIFTITVPAFAPSDITLSNDVILPCLPSGTAIGSFSVTDLNTEDTHTLSLVGGAGSTNNASFTLVGSELRTAAALEEGTYSIRVNANDGTHDYSKSFTITVGISYPLSNGADTIYYITNVSFNTINRSSTTETGGYVYSSDTVTTVKNGLSYTLSVINNPTEEIYEGWPQYIKAWIDWNKDGDFDDAGESYIVGDTLTEQTTSKISIVVPEAAIAGMTRLRVSLQGSDSGVFPPNSGTFDYGEVEDYSISIEGDTTPPEVSSINRQTPLGGTTNTTSVVFRITFSENVSGVDSSDFALNVTGTADGSIASISGSNNVYDITVNDVTGDGTLRLDLKNIGTEITDAKGNAINGGYTNGQTYTIDNTAPSINTINRNTPAEPSTNSDNLVYRVTFSETVNNVDTGDFTLTTSGTVDGSIASVSASSGTTVDVTVNSISGEGTLRLNLNNAGAGIVDNAGNAINGGFLGGQDYTIDVTAPEPISIERQNPLGSYTNSTSVVYRVTFSESVDGVDVGDFTLTKTGTANGSIASVSSSSGSTIDITANTISGNGTLRLDLKNASTGIVDSAGNAITGGLSSGQTYTIDTTAPSVSSIIRQTPANENTSSTILTYQVAFSKSVSGVSVDDFTLTKTGTADGTIESVSASTGTTVDVTINSISGDGTLRLDLNNNGTGITDSVGNAINGGYTDGQTYTIDRIAPTVSSISRQNPVGASTNAANVIFRVTFEESVTGVSVDDFTLTKTGTADGTIESVSASTGTTIDVTINSISGDGTLRLDLNNNGTGITDSVGNAINGGFTSGQTYTVDRAAPFVTSINRNNPVGESTNSESVIYRVTFSESVSGVDISDFSLTKTGTADGHIASVSSASGTTIDVTVNTISGVGTVRLDLNNAATGITDALGNEISGGHATGQLYTIDRSEPSILSLTPSDGSINASTSNDLIISFSENVVKGTGNITIYKSNHDQVEVIDVTSTKVAINDNIVTIDPDALLSVNTGYYVQIDATAIDDEAGNSYSGISDTTSWNFTTAASNNANLSSLTLSSGSLNPVFSSNTFNYTVNVANSISNITVTPTVEQENATVQVKNEDVISGASSQAINLNVGANTVSITVKAQDNSTLKTYTLTITRAAPPPSDPTPASPPATSAVVEVNGERQDAGQASTQTNGETTVTTITVDDTKLNNILEQNGNNATVTLPFNTASDVVVGQLNGQTVKNMEVSEATLEIKTETVTYTLPASQINIDAVSQQIGEQVALKDIKVNVKIAEPSQDTAKIVEDTAQKGNYQLVVKPIEFEITCTSGDKTVEVSRFNGYVERTVAIPDGVDPRKITTGVVLNADGTFSHVPTEIVVISGKYYAKINSLTNSTYSVIWNPMTFSDLAGYGATGDAINDMGSRLIISGVGNNKFAPERDITRAEFSVIIVKALGLRPAAGKSSFSDVAAAAGYAPYIQTAYEYGIISGYGNGKFGPDDKITREQVMTMIGNAMKITQLKVAFDTGEMDKILSDYTDSGKIISWGRESMAACIKAGITSGRGSMTLAPKATITRAEVAILVRKLLVKSGLI